MGKYHANVSLELRLRHWDLWAWGSISSFCPQYVNSVLFIFFIFCCVGSLMLQELFSSCSELGLLSSYSAQAFCSSGFSCCRAWAVGTWASVVVHGLSSAQLLSHVGLFAIPWTAAYQASLSFSIFQSLLKYNWWCYLTTSFSAIPFSFCL